MTLSRRPGIGSRARQAMVLLWGLGLLALSGAAGVEALSPVLRWDSAMRGQAGQLSVFNADAEGGYFGLPVQMGDWDADGNVDLALSPMAAASGPGKTRARAGEVYVYRGDRRIEGTLDRKAMGTTPAGLTIQGARPDDFLGTELYSADVNGDGVSDLLLTAQNWDGPLGDRPNCGGGFVVLGRPGLLGAGGAGRTIDLASSAEGVIAIVGRSPGDRLGIWIEAGDLDGDGIGDILIGADQAAAPGGKVHAGMTAVIYGRSDLPPVLDLAQAGEGEGAIPGVSLIHGRDAEDHFGASLHARDLDGDGLAELIAAAALNRLSASFGGFPPPAVAHAQGAGDGPDNARPECGEVVVLFGDPALPRLPPVLDLAALPPAIAARTAVIHGQKADETAGEEIATGDFNGDRIPDLVLGALTATSPEGRLQAGAAHLIYGGPDLRGMVIDLRRPETYPAGLRVSHIHGLREVDILGDTLSAGDFNNDGHDDLAVGIPHFTFQDRLQAGEVAVLFGQPEYFPEQIVPDLPDLPVRVAYVLGPSSGDLLAYSMEAGDYDGDGYADLFPNAMRGNGAAEDTLDAGEAYLISGFRLSEARFSVAGVIPPEAPLDVEAEVEIAGSGFTTGADTRVLLDGVEVMDIRVLSGTRIACRFPARATAGTVPVTVENRYGSSTIPQGFRYGISTFLRGDSDGSGEVDITDPILTMGFLFLGAAASCLDRHDSNDDGALDLSDPIYTLSALFLGGPLPRPPFPQPGVDPTVDPLDCT